MSFKRLLFLGHRWVGVLLSLFFVIWFFSGMVMLYVGYPRSDHDARISAQPPVEDATCCDAALPPVAPGERLRLRMLDGQLLVGSGRQWRHAESARPLGGVDAATARRVAVRHVDGDAVMRRLESIEDDQWTVTGRYDGHRPLHRAVFDDGRWLHISASTGEVLLDTARWERGWNWVGAVSHWLYFSALRRHGSLWSEIVVWLSLAGCLLAISGLWGGLRQWRWRRRKRGKSPIPYRGVAFWHHAGGLVFGVLVFTFILSGLFSMNPWGLFQFNGVDAEDRRALTGDVAPLPMPELAAAWQRFAVERPDFTARELEVFAFDGRWWLRFRNGQTSAQLMAVDGGEAREALPERSVEATAQRLTRGRPVADQRWRDAPDRYYYRSRGERPLPVLRLQLADADRSWYYLDPAAGDIALKTDRHRRAYRWWFNALHSLDFPWLIHNRPLWDLVVILVSLGGLLVSATGLLVGYRRLRSALRRRVMRA